MNLIKMKTLISSIFIVAIFSGLPNWINANKTLVNSMNQMSIDLFKTLLHDEIGNFVCSPLSVGKVLSMAAYGAHGKTEEELLKVLHINSEKEKISDYANFNFSNELNDVLKMADKMYVSKKFKLSRKYSNIFESKIESLNFDNSENTTKMINNWVKSQTNNRIKDLITSDDVKKNSRLFLINAIHFKGSWERKFTQTDPKPFYLNNRKSIMVDIMTTSYFFDYKDLKDIDAKIIRLPYKLRPTSESISMFLIVPNKIEGLKKIEENIDEINFDTLHDTMKKRHIKLSLPKFKIEKKINLKKHLKKMGINHAFESGANFSGITQEDNMFIDDIGQKVFIAVDEYGTEAAATTNSEIEMQQLPLEINVNRPFLVILATRNVIIFTARVTDPTL